MSLPEKWLSRLEVDRLLLNRIRLTAKQRSIDRGPLLNRGAPVPFLAQKMSYRTLTGPRFLEHFEVFSKGFKYGVSTIRKIGS
jgi:hypothetical protein